MPLLIAALIGIQGSIGTAGLLAESKAPEKIVWNFDSDAEGKTATGFTTVVGKWSVVADGKNRVLAQTARSDDSVFNLALIDDANYADVDLSVRLKAIAGKVDQGGGVVWRAKDAKNYYVCRFNPLEDSFRVYKVVGGKRTQLETTKVPGDNDWRTLRITMRGDHIECFLDGKLHLKTDDKTFRRPGSIGLWAKADANSYFDDLTAIGVTLPRDPPAEIAPTREFEIKNSRAWLGGNEVDLWGLRCGNALYTAATVERHIRNFDNMAAHGINLIGVYIQGVNAGWPNSEAGINGFTRDGRLKPDVAKRLEALIREADKRGMVVMVGVLTPRKDQDFYDDAAIQRAVEETARFLTSRKLRNVFVDLCHEFNSPERMDKEILREPRGEEKKAQLQKWFKAIAPDIEAGVCPHFKTDTKNHYPGMDVRIIQKDMPIPDEGWVVNVEPVREDAYQNDGVFNQTNLDAVFANCRRYRDAPHAVFMFHAAFLQGITNFSGTAPHAEMGGYGTGPDDRGIRFYYEWVRDNIGRWEYPRHVPVEQ
jgi:hypothetical protein